MIGIQTFIIFMGQIKMINYLGIIIKII